MHVITATDLKTHRLAKPDVPDTAEVTLDGERIVFVAYETDPTPVNPCEDWEGLGSIRSLSTRHLHSISGDEARTLLANDTDVIRLSYFEHGQCMWGVQGTMSNTPDFQWDGAHFAGIWIPDSCVKDSAEYEKLVCDTPERRAWMATQAAAACEVYTEWCNGYVYTWAITAYLVRYAANGEAFDTVDDYRFDSKVYDASCSGYYGDDNLQAALTEGEAAYWYDRTGVPPVTDSEEK